MFSLNLLFNLFNHANFLCLLFTAPDLDVIKNVNSVIRLIHMEGKIDPDDNEDEIKFEMLARVHQGSFSYKEAMS